MLLFIIPHSSMQTLSPTFGFSKEMSFSAWMPHRTLYADQVPIIKGKISDNDGIPLSSVKVQVSFSQETLESFTDKDGLFKITATVPESVGDHMVTVIAEKEGFEIYFASINFKVLEQPTSHVSPQNPVDIINDIPKVMEDVSKTLEYGVTQNPLSQLLAKQLEEMQNQKAAEEKRLQELAEKNKLLDQQRIVAKQSLENDLNKMEKDTEFFSPQNAFARFVASIDQTVQGIFWGQFALTEKKSNEAHAAKMAALEDGKTSVEAMKIFQRKAAISRNEIIQHNKNLNIEYGFTNKTQQNLFNDDGKIQSQN